MCVGRGAASLYSSGWLGAHCVDKARENLRTSAAYRMLALKGCTATTGLGRVFKWDSPSG
ncbi:hypothetical protein I79_011827 [Cricetulus griseus]|uniref:Uncharacterized protein n=1 Tax=Cricetulus griseus TaxID=10029 RepID=G3HM78_CRIGR|nr:hypothetical protein I79_011827 [Cricetulus griseus]